MNRRDKYELAVQAMRYANAIMIWLVVTSLFLLCALRGY